MPIPVPSFAFFLRIGACLGALLLAGCAADRHTASTQVTSPPPPRFGSGPIAAYDEFALSVAPLPPTVRAEMVAQNSPH